VQAEAALAEGSAGSADLLGETQGQDLAVYRAAARMRVISSIETM
jgi:hypothetical protein